MIDKFIAILVVACIFTLLVAGIYTATIRPWYAYAAAFVAYLLILVGATAWAMQGADGPDGFGVGLVFGLIFWVTVFAHIVRWLYEIATSLRKFFKQNERE